MTQSIHVDSAATVAARIKEARLATGMSTRAVADLIRDKFPGVSISHATIANYEKLAASPPMKILEIFATIYERPLKWFLERSEPLRGVRYRCVSSRVLVRERNQYETQAQHWLEGYTRIERRLKQRLTPTKKIKAAYKDESPEKLAEIVRTEWDYRPKDAIRSVIEIMEGFGIRVIELQTPFRIDGLAAQFGSEFAVVLNPSQANDRSRLNAAHELAHVLYGDCITSGRPTRAMDDRAFEFACSLLIPPAELKDVFIGRSAVALKEAKEYRGISMAAMIYRAEKLGIIDARAAKKLWIQFAKRGWRANEPGFVRPDRATRLETMIEKAVLQKQVTWSEAATTLGVSRAELDHRIRQAIQPPEISDGHEQEGAGFGPRLFSQS
ncbi:MAG: ImmA/IrrE family metallo-endopeptidase [Planctomycetales bacterium]|nr:ImmA/IrrE family metallo-endopeptidase [Planctomycetales bacterium]